MILFLLGTNTQYNQNIQNIASDNIPYSNICGFLRLPDKRFMPSVAVGAGPRKQGKRSSIRLNRHFERFIIHTMTDRAAVIRFRIHIRPSVLGLDPFDEFGIVHCLRLPSDYCASMSVHRLSSLSPSGRFLVSSRFSDKSQ